MGYVKQNFTNGQVLTATHLNHIEDGIAAVADVDSKVSEMGAELSYEINRVKADVTAVSEDVTAVEKSVSSVKKSVTALEGDIATLEGEIPPPKFRIIITADSSGTLTMNKTMAKIRAAYDDGAVVEAVYNNAVYPLVQVTGSGTSRAFVFQTAIFNTYYRVSIASGGTVSAQSGSLATTQELAEVEGTIPHTADDVGAVPAQISSDSKVNIPATNTVTGKIAYNDKTTDGTDHAQGIYSIFDVSGAKTIFVTGYQWQSQYNVYSYVFYDADGSTISKHLATTDDTGFTDLEVTVPENAATIRINGKTPAYVPAVKGYEKIDIAEAVKQLVLEDKVTSVNGKTGAVELTADDVGSVPKNLACREVLIEPTSTVTGKVAWNENVTGGGDHVEGIYSIFDISGYNTIFVTGYQWQAQYSYYSYVFYAEDGTTISKAIAAADDTGFVDLEVAVPENAKTIRINGKTRLYTPVVKYFETVDVSEVIKDVVNAQKFPKVITMGDSITALGLQPQGWVKYFLEATGCELIANTAVVGAILMDRENTVYDGEPVFNGDDANENNVLGNQVQKIINQGYEAPDLIMIAIGTNAGINITADQMKAAYYASDGSLIPLGQVDRTTAAGAYRYCLDTLHTLYPDAVICWCTPIHAHEQIRAATNVMAWAESLRIATEFTGQILIDTIRCGINGINEANNANGEYLMDGLHPNAAGAKKIGYYNASKVKPFIENLHVKG